METRATLLAWPAARSEGATLVAQGRPVVWLVDRVGEPPSDWCDVEDWVRVPVDAAELAARVDGVEQRARRNANRPRVDDDDLLWRDDQWVALSPLEARLVRTLLDRANHVVSRRAVCVAGWPDEPTGFDLNGAIKAVRRKVEPMGVTVHTITGRGYLAEVAP